MKSFGILKMAATVAVVGAGFTFGAGPESALQAAVDSAGKTASLTREVESLLVKQKTEKAIAYAEKLVAARPDNASFRMVLGQAYLQAGRFRAAGTSFSDVLSLSPGHERAALNLALTQIALGQNDNALETLQEYRDGLKSADLGLALALAGQTQEGLRILEAAARETNASARTRQNLALVYAMSGQWIESRSVMAQDLSPELVDARIVEWATFVRPKAAWDQVAAILKVTPVYDPGQPSALALNAPSAPAQLAAVAPVAEPVAAPEPAADVPPPAAFEVTEPVRANAVSLALAEPEPAVEPSIADALPQASSSVVFAPRAEVVQPLPQRAVRPTATKVMASAPRPAPLIKAASAPAKQRLAAGEMALSAPTSQSGKFVVQLGAYSSSKAAERAWNRNAQRFGLASRDPHQATIRIRSTTLYRLSVAGYVNRSDALRICGQVREEGGNCFVRRIAGEAVPMWAKRSPVGKERLQLAQR